MFVTKERCHFSLLVIIAGTVPGSSLQVSTSNFLLRPTAHLGIDHGRLFPLKVASSRSEDEMPTGNKSPWTAPQQLSMISAAAPLKLVAGSIAGIFGLLTREMKSLTFHQQMVFAATFCLGFFLGRVRPFWKRFTDVNDIPSSLFGKNAPALRGRAITVSDGDTIRFLHQPTPWFHPSKLQKGEKASVVALPIRLCTIDTPETAKFGKPGQPFGPEAKSHLKSMLEDKLVYVRLLQKDQYSRAVAEVFTGKFPFWQRYMDAEMLEEGLAEVYTGGGAVYGPLGKDEYMAIEAKARKAKKGIWSLGKRESAAEYKKRTK